MAPSGEHRPEELGQATVRAAAVATSNSAAVLRERVTSLSRMASGKTLNEQLEILTAQAGIAEKVSANLKIVADALQIREAAAKAWNRDAPKDSEIKVARDAVTAAKKKLADAATASGDTSAAKTELEAAQNKLGELRRKRREADKAYDKAEEKAAEKLKEITRDEHGADGRDGTPDSTDSGTPTPGTASTSPGATSPRPSGENGKRADPSKTTTGGTPKPSTTAPSATKPSSTETNSGDDLSSLLTQLASQQQPQSQQGQQAQPAASTPQQATPQQQPEKDKDTPQDKTNPLEKLLGPDGVLDTADLAALGINTGTTAPAGIPHSTPAASVTPSAPAPAAPATTGLSASATANAQPVSSGTSTAGLHTSSDVTGRSGEPRGAFSVGPETKTSGASGGSNAAPASATGTRPMGGTGMPAMGPMGAMGGPGGGGSKDRDKEQVTAARGSAESDLLHGRHTAAEAVPGGTIARGDGRRSGPPADAA